MKKRIYLLFIFTIAFLFGFLLSQKPTYAVSGNFHAYNVVWNYPNLSFTADNGTILEGDFNPDAPITTVNIYNPDYVDAVQGCDGNSGGSYVFPKNTNPFTVSITDMTSDAINAGDCATMSLLGGQIEIYDGGSTFYYSQVLSSGDFTPAATPTPTVAPTATPTVGPTATPYPVGEFVLGASNSAKINAALGSIPKEAQNQVFAIFPYVLPYLLVIVALMIFFVMWRMMKNYNNSKKDPVDSNNRNKLWEKDYIEEYDNEMSTGSFTEEEANNNATSFADSQDDARNNGSI